MSLRLASDASVTGFEAHPLYQAIRELVDNSLDGGSLNIVITAIPTASASTADTADRSNDNAAHVSWALAVDDDGHGIAAYDVARLVGSVGATTRVDNGFCNVREIATMGRFGVGLKALIAHAQRSNKSRMHVHMPLHIVTLERDSAAAAIAMRVGIDQRNGSVIIGNDAVSGETTMLLNRCGGTSVNIELDDKMKGTGPRLAAYFERLRALPGTANITAVVVEDGGTAFASRNACSRPTKQRRGTIRHTNVASNYANDRVIVCVPSLKTVRQALVDASYDANETAAAAAADDDCVTATYLASHFSVTPECVTFARVGYTSIAARRNPTESRDASMVPEVAVVVRVFVVLERNRLVLPPIGTTAAHGHHTHTVMGTGALGQAEHITPDCMPEPMTTSSIGSRVLQNGNRAATANSGHPFGIIHVLRYANGRPLLGDADVCGITNAVRRCVAWQEFGLQVQPWASSSEALTPAGARSKRGDIVLATAPSLPVIPHLDGWDPRTIDADEQPLLCRSTIADVPFVPFRTMSLFIDVADNCANDPVTDSQQIINNLGKSVPERRSAVRFGGLRKSHVQENDELNVAIADATRAALTKLRDRLPDVLLSPKEQQLRMLRMVYVPTIAAQLARVCSLGGSDFQGRAAAAIGVTNIGHVDVTVRDRLMGIIESTLSIVTASSADALEKILDRHQEDRADRDTALDCCSAAIGSAAPPFVQVDGTWWNAEDAVFGQVEADVTAARLRGSRGAAQQARKIGARSTVRTTAHTTSLQL